MKFEPGQRVIVNPDAFDRSDPWEGEVVGYWRNGAWIVRELVHMTTCAYSADRLQWATEPCPDPRFGGMHLEVMFQSHGVPYCGCPPCDAAFPGYRMPYNANQRVFGGGAS